MRIKLAPIATLIGLLSITVSTQAEGPESSLVNGDTAAGKAKAMTCTACHGPEGNSNNALWPNIAGQSATYVLAQLKAFKGRPANNIKPTRNDPLMSTQAMLLSEQDMADLAVYFESLPLATQAVADASTVARGEALYRGGNPEKGTTACLACHGPSGRGNPAAAYPALRGQHAKYTIKQLNDYASGARTSDGKTQQMRDIAATLNKEDIEALASYMQGLK